MAEASSSLKEDLDDADFRGTAPPPPPPLPSGRQSGLSLWYLQEIDVSDFVGTRRSAEKCE